MHTQENILKKTNTDLISSIKKITFFIILALVVPAFIHAQWITGPLVNAILFLSVIYCGLSGAILAGMIPSVIALSAGLLPAPLAAAVPYIIVSNAIMVSIFFAFYNKNKSKKNFLLGAGFGALLKFGFLYMITSTIVKLVSPQVAPKVAAMLSWPQLITAMIGGAIAFVVYKNLTPAPSPN